MQLIDQIGQIHHFDRSILRVVSLVPSQTELLVDLGLEDLIVGVTKFCVHPNRIRSIKEVIGGTKQVNFEKISSLNPDLIIANKEENTAEMIDRLKELAPVWVTDIVSIEDSLKMVSDFGVIFSVRVQAQKLLEKLTFALRDFQSFVKARPLRKVVYFIWANPYMVAANKTFINSLLELNHFENIYANQDRYPEVELKKIRLEGDPELVLLASEPFPFKDKQAFEIGRFTHHAKTVFVDGEFFSWYGSRLIKAFDYFKLLHTRLE